MSEEDTQEETTEEAPTEDEVEAPKREKKQKKVVRRRKSKKEKERPLISAIRLAVESGKVDFGARTGMADAGKAKLFVVAQNTPSEIKNKILSCAKTSKVPLIEFDGSSMELGSVCGKPFPVSVLSVYEEGSSNILDLAKK